VGRVKCEQGGGMKLLVQKVRVSLEPIFGKVCVKQGSY